MRRQQKAQIAGLFGSLVSGDLDTFLSGCAEDLIITFRGTSPEATRLYRSDIPDWFGSLQALSTTSLRSSVEVGRVEQSGATVLLSHSFSRHGIDYRLETVNLVTYRDGLLATWSSYPFDLSEYARAWRTRESALLQPA